MKKLKPFSLKSLDFISDEKVDDKSVQGSEAWRIDKAGCFSGSNMRHLMSCNNKGKRMKWSVGDPEQIVAFGRPAEKYIYQVGMERRTGILSMEPKSRELEHGKTHEPLW